MPDDTQSHTLLADTFLVLEDNVLLALDAAASVTAAGYDVVMTARGGEALAMLETRPLTGAILDFSVQDGNAVEVARRLMAHDIPFRVVSAHGADVIEMAGIPADLIVSKPTNYTEVVSAILRARAA